ncbi:MAG: hypothetical protein ACOYKQ_06230, partial [Polymorphobacter sp.]
MADEMDLCDPRQDVAGEIGMNAEVPPMVRHDGGYASVPLRSDKIAIGIVQTPVRAVDGDNP